VKPAAVYYAGLAPDAGTLVRQAKGLGLQSTFISGDAIRFDDFYRMAGTAGSGASAITCRLPEAR